MLRSNRIEYWNIAQNISTIWEIFDWTEVNRIGNPFEYGIIYSPMGPYDHSWFVRIGYPVYIRDRQNVTMPKSQFSIHHYHHKIVVLLVHIVLAATTSYGSICASLSDGAFTDPEIWSCGCDAVLCDTLMIGHVVQLDETVGVSELDLRHVWIVQGGSLICTGDIRLYASLNNEGVLSSDRLALWSSRNLYNTGTISGNQLLFIADSTFNYGTIDAVDSLISGVLRPFHNHGNVASTHCVFFGQLANWGTIQCDDLFAQRSVYNTSTIIASHTIELRSFSENIGMVTCASLVQGSGTLVNRGSIHLSDTLIVDTGGVTVDLEAGSVVLTNDLWVGSGSFINGPGSICVVEHSENHGTLTAVRICDLTPTLTEPPYLDIHTGELNTMLTIYYCNATTCASVSIPEPAATLAPKLFPNPTAGTVHVEWDPGTAVVHEWTLLDVLGQRMMHSNTAVQERLVLDLATYAQGTYWLVLQDEQGSVLQRVPVVVAR
jgi:hypothetical protein